MQEIGEICARKKGFFHTDAAQAVGKMPINVGDLNIALMSISAHKMYGPKGVGALYVRRKPRVRMRAVIDGGGQERGMRSGTLATPIIVGMGAAAQVCQQEMANDESHITRLTNKLYGEVTRRLPKVTLNGHEEKRYIGNLNISFEC